MIDLAPAGGPAAGAAGRRVSLCLVVRDEAADLPACLASAREAVDEVVVVDTGSRDGTPELARRAGAVVLDPPVGRRLRRAAEPGGPLRHR